MDSADSLLEKCKQKVKLLMEFYITCKHIHWSHPSVLDFCVTVENILSFGAKKEVKRFGRKDVDQLASLRILASLSQNDPLCAEAFQQCYPSACKRQAVKSTVTANSGQSKDYLTHNESSLEYGILWIRASLIEKKLSEIVQVFIKNAQSYYSNHSIIANEVNADIFSFLLSGPCSVRLTQLKPVDIPSSTSPTELVERMKVLSSRCPKFTPVNSYVWDHMESLYQHSSSVCLFGKNNTVIVMHGKELNGYLSLHQENSDVVLKWIPSTLFAVDDNLTTSFHCDSSELIDMCLSVNISKEIAYLHCHKAGERAQLVMVNFDGVAIVTTIFRHHSTILSFLECLESGLLPKGCLQPPLFYLKSHHHKIQKSKSNPDISSGIVTTHPVSMKASHSNLQLKSISPHAPMIEPNNSAEVTNATDDGTGKIWNQVFAVRCGSHPTVKNLLTLQPTDCKKSSILMGEIPACQYSQSSPSRLAVIMPTPDQCGVPKLNSTMYAGGNDKEMINNSTESDHKRNKIIQDLLERKQKELSGSLHRSNLQKNISHMLLATRSYHLEEDSSILTDETLQLLTDADGRITNWGKVLSCIYNGGIEHLLRPKVWPLLLGVYPHDASSNEKELIYQQNKCKYEELLREGKQLEETANAATAATNERKRSDSEVLGEMLSKMNNNNSDKQNHSFDDNESETKMDPRCYQYMQELEIIDKDVNRCDRNYEYYKSMTNLSKLRNIISCYCLDNLKEKEMYYVQGMTDLLAPLLTLEPEFFQMMQQQDFLFCRRWFLLAFKREFSYNDIFRLWETMWAAEQLVTNCFMEFFALSLLRQYIPTIMHKRMDTVEMLILFGEMESRQHNGEFETILRQTLSLISQIQHKLATE